MSYDVDLIIDVGGETPHTVASMNITSNLEPMFREAGIDLRNLDGRLAATTASRLLSAANHMDTHPHRYKPMEPANGWGDYDTARRWLRELAGHCQSAPACRLRVSW